jgi:YtkA-like
MVRDRLSNIAVSLLLLHASSLASGCSKSSSTSNDVGFSCESDPTPSRVGLNTFTITLTAGGSERLSGAHVSLEGDMSHPGMSPVFSETKEIVPGRYQGTLDLHMRGDWTVLFHITLTGGRTFDRQLILRNIQAT